MKKLLTILLLAVTSLSVRAAELKWYIQNDSTHERMLVSEVAYSFVSDYSATFCVVGTDGAILTDVSSASFVQLDPSTGIGKTATKDADIKPVQVGGTLTVSGIKQQGEVAVYSLNGVKVASAKAIGGSVDVNVQCLPTGVYILRVGNTSVKIMKQ